MSGDLVVERIYEAGEVVGLVVKQAPPLIFISQTLLDRPVPFVEVGEGLFVINARNATVRYRLLENKGNGTWSAQRIDHERLTRPDVGSVARVGASDRAEGGRL